MLGPDKIYGAAKKKMPCTSLIFICKFLREYTLALARHWQHFMKYCFCRVSFNYAVLQNYA